MSPELGDNCIQKFNLERYFVGYTVGNLVLQRHVSGAIKRDFQMLSPPVTVKYFTDCSKAVLLLWIFFFVFSLLCLCGRLFICALWSPAGKGLTSWLSFVVYNCEFVTFPLVSWVRCGT